MSDFDSVRDIEDILDSLFHRTASITKSSELKQEEVLEEQTMARTTLVKDIQLGLKLSNENWYEFKDVFLINIDAAGLIDVINDPDKATAEQDKIVKTVLVNACSSEIRAYILHLKDSPNSSHLMWNVLKKKYEKLSLIDSIHLRDKLWSRKLKRPEDVEEHLEYMRNIFRKIKATTDKFDLETEFILTVLRSLTPDFKMVQSLSANNDVLTIDNVFPKIVSHANELIKQAEVDSTPKMTTFKLSSKIKRNCSFCKRVGHTDEKCWAKHPELRPKRDNKNAGSSRASIMFSSFSTKLSLPNEFILDSGASHHFVANKSLLTDIELIEPKPIDTPDGVLVTTTKGKLEMKAVGGKLIFEAYYVEGFKINAISQNRCWRNGARVYFDNKTGSIKISKDGIYFIAEICDEGLHKISCFSSKLWHEKLGHVNNQTVKAMSKQFEYISSDNRDCLSCIENKLSKPKFSTKPRNENLKQLDLVQADLCGPYPTGVNGGRYYITITDEFSKLTRLTILKNKSDVFEAIKEYVNWSNTQSGKKIKRFLSDNGGEFSNSKVKQLFNEHGIEFELTPPYTPELNGVSERKNRTINDSARTMLNTAKFPVKYWEYAVMHAVYLQNRLPSSAIDGQIPFQKFFDNRNISLKKLMPFGTLCFSVTRKRSSKMSPHGKPYTIVGKTENGYLLFDPVSNNEVLSRNVRPVEGQYFNFDRIKTKVDNVQVCSKDETISLSFEIVRTDSENTTTSQIPSQSDLLNSSPTDISISTNSDNLIESSESTTNSIPTNSTNTNSEEPSASTSTDLDPNQLRRSNRTNFGVPPVRYDEDRAKFLSSAISTLNREITVPSSYEEAIQSPQKPEWIIAMNDELNSLHEHDVYEEVNYTDQRLINSKLLFSTKTDRNGFILRYKCRLVGKGYSQREDEDYTETFSPVVDKSTVRLMLTLATKCNWSVKMVDVKTAFLNGPLEETIYIKPPEPLCEPNKCWKLKKSLYGLRQSGHNWNQLLNTILLNYGLMRSEIDQCLFYSPNLRVLSYVDDLLLFGNPSEIEKFIKYLKSKVEIHEINVVNRFLGVNVEKKNGKFLLDQTDFIQSLSNKFHLPNVNVSKPLASDVHISESDPKTDQPVQSLIGALLYISNWTRPDVACAVAKVAQYTHLKCKSSFRFAIQILKYLNCTRDHKLVLHAEPNSPILSAYADSGFLGPDSKSQSGFVIKLHGSTIRWMSKKQTVVATSTCEAEYIALASATSHLVGVYQQLYELNIRVDLPIPVYEDNQSALAAVYNGTKIKHIQMRFHFFRQYVLNGLIEPVFIESKFQLADTLTKEAPRTDFKIIRDQILGVP